MNRNLLFSAILIIGFVTLPKHCDSFSTKVDYAHVQIDLLESALYRLGTDICRLPTTEEGLRLLVVTDKPIEGWEGHYLPKPVPLDPWGHEYQYYCPPRYGNKKFDLYSFGADGKDDGGEGDDISNWKGYDRKY